MKHLTRIAVATVISLFTCLGAAWRVGAEQARAHRGSHHRQHQ